MSESNMIEVSWRNRTTGDVVRIVSTFLSAHCPGHGPHGNNYLMLRLSNGHNWTRESFAFEWEPVDTLTSE